MIIKYQTTIGKNKIAIECQKMSELHKWNSVYGNLPDKCTACESDNIFLSYKNPKGNEYYMVECGQCGATANFGQHKDGSGLYWKDDKMEVYQANGDNNHENNSTKMDGADSSF